MKHSFDLCTCMCILLSECNQGTVQRSPQTRERRIRTHRSPYDAINAVCRHAWFFYCFCSKTSRTWTRCSFAKASGGQKTELISHLKRICIDTFWQHTGCFKNYFVDVLKTRLGYRHTDDYVWPFNCLEFFWVHKYPFKRCGWFFGIWKAELIFAFLDAREQGKRLKLSQWQVRKIHDTVKRMLSYAGPVWKRLHLTIWTPSWELKQTEHFLDAC